MNKKMRMLFVAGMVMMGGMATQPPKVEVKTVKVDTGFGSFYLPFQVVNGTQLYSFKDGRGYPGAETVLASCWRYQLTAGAAPVLGTDVNVPFVAIQHRLNPNIFDTSDNELQFGVWAGKPSVGKRWTLGVKASVPLW